MLEDSQSFLGNITSAHELQSKYNKPKSQPLGPIIPHGNNAAAPVPRSNRTPSSTEYTGQSKLRNTARYNGKLGKHENVMLSTTSTNNPQNLKTHGQSKYGTVLVGDSTNYSQYLVNSESDAVTRQTSELSKNHPSTDPTVTTYTKIDMPGMIKDGTLPNAGQGGEGPYTGEFLQAQEVRKIMESTRLLTKP